MDCGFYSECDGKPEENFEHSLTLSDLFIYLFSLSDLNFTMIT